MSAPPYMRLYWGDYHRDTHHLSRSEHGAYLLLISALWGASGKLADDDALLARLSKSTPEEWGDLRPVLMPYFKVVRGKITHKRVTAELAKYDDTLRKRKQAGKLGGEASAGKPKRKSTAHAEHLPTKPEPEPEKITPVVPLGDGSAQTLELLPEEPPAPADPVQQAFDLWNDTASRCKLPRATGLTDRRRRAMRARMDAEGLPRWRLALDAVERSRFCRGLVKGKDFKADLDFVCQAKSFQRLIEGYYGDDIAPPPAVIIAGPRVDPWDFKLRRFVSGSRYWNDAEDGPRPGKDGCQAPAEILAKYGYGGAEIVPFPIEGRAA